ncbi:MAG: AsmA family protein [Alphaproteobacteria bacterium]|nr:MAG: AsmA family protein [Alphaproteobacteria bacterium]
MTRRKLAKIAYWTLGSLVGLVVLVSVVLSFLDWNQYRETLAGMASERLGMRVELAGDVKLGIIPRPSVSVQAVRMSPQGDGPGETVATADRIEMQLGLSALLSGRIAVAQLNLDGLSVMIEEKPAGNWQVKGWPESDPAAEKPDSGPTNIQLDKLQLTGGRISIQPFGQPVRTIEGLSFRLSGMLPRGPLEWDGEFTSAGERVTTDGRLRPSAERDDISFKADLGFGGGTLSLSGRLGDVDGGGRVQLEAASLAKFVAAAQHLATGAKDSMALPDVPLQLDLQLDRDGGVTKVASRQIVIGDTQGRLDVTVATSAETPHLTGTLALGIIELQPWLDAMATPTGQPAATPANVPTGKASAMPVTGTLDISVEALRFAGDAIQHLDAEVGIASDGPYIAGLHGLMPGGSTLDFTGRIGADKGGEGKLNMASGNLQQLLKWAGMDVSGSVQPGRLSTAEIAANVRVEPETWLLYDIKGKVDTMALNGAIAGSRDGGLPTLMTLAADQINLDAYMPAPSDGPLDIAALLPATDLKFDLQADKMQWQSQQFAGIRLRGQAGKSRVVIEQGDIRHQDGWLAAVGDARQQGGDWTLDLNLALEKWHLPFVRALVPDAVPYINALQAGSISGQAALAGPLNSLRLSSKLDHGAGTWVLNGSVGLKDGAANSLNMQGTVTHRNLAPLARLMGMAEARDLPANLTFSAARPSAASAIALRISGDVGGGQLITDGTVSENATRFQATYDHSVAAQAFRRLGLMLKAPEPAKPVRAEMTFALTGDNWRLDSMNVRNGNALVRGDLAGNLGGKVGGSVALSGYKVRMGALGDKTPSEDEEFTIPTGWEHYAGNLDIAIENLTASGQRLDAPKAVLQMAGGQLHLDLGAGAKLNGENAVAKLDVAGGAKPSLTAQIDIGGFDVASFLSSQKLGAIASGTAALKLDIAATGTTGTDLLKTARGRGTLSGGVGALKFLAVPKLVKEMSSAQSGTAFLRNIGSTLRGGQTEFSKVEAAFSIDSGTALVETLKALGDWGSFVLDGQINLVDQRMDMKGELDLSAPQDAPVIPVAYKGSLTEPTANWTSRALESFVISGIERKIRTSLFKEQEAAAANSDKPADSPGTAAFGQAFDMLLNLKKKQEEKKKAEEEKAEGSQDKPKEES